MGRCDIDVLEGIILFFHLHANDASSAAALLADGDVLVVAGKGHEQGQTIGGHVLPFDDVAVTRDALAGEGRRG